MSRASAQQGRNAHKRLRIYVIALKPWLSLSTHNANVTNNASLSKPPWIWPTMSVSVNVWDHFDKQGGGDGGPKRVVCNRCGHTYQRWDFRTAMLYHLEREHPTVLPPEMRAARATRGRSTEPGQLKLTQMKRARRGTASWDAYAVRAMRALADRMLPLGFFEHASIDKLIVGGGPAAPRFTRKTMSQLVNRAFDRLMVQFKTVAGQVGKALGLACDIWTSPPGDAFIGVTVHYVDPSTFEMKRGAVACKWFPERHTAEAIRDELAECLQRAGIGLDYVQGMVTDNASNITKAVTEAKMLSFRCLAHTLQLSLKVLEPKRARVDDLQAERDAIVAASQVARSHSDIDSDEVDDSDAEAGLEQTRRLAEIRAAEKEEEEEAISDDRTPGPDPHITRFHTLFCNIKRIVAYFRRSAHKQHCLREAQRRALSRARRTQSTSTSQDTSANALPEWEKPITTPLKLEQHNATRWNSKAFMLGRYCRLHPFVRDVLRDTTVPAPDEVLSSIPTDEDVAELKMVLPLLGKVLKATDALQGDKFPTLGLVLPWLQHLRTRLAPVREDPPMVAAVKSALWSDIDRRFEAMLDGARLQMAGTELKYLQPVLACAALLTPTSKSFGSSGRLYHFERDAAITALKRVIASFCQPGACPVSGCAQHERTAGTDASRAYAGPDPDDPDEAISRQSSSASSVPDQWSSELEQYFRLEYDSPQAWSNEWWASHSARFPHVAMAARKVLCVPATSAAVERFFSCAGHVTRPLRNRLAVERVEKLAVLSYNHPNDWQWDLWSRERSAQRST